MHKILGMKAMVLWVSLLNAAIIGVSIAGFTLTDSTTAVNTLSTYDEPVIEIEESIEMAWDSYPVETKATVEILEYTAVARQALDNGIQIELDNAEKEAEEAETEEIELIAEATPEPTPEPTPTPTPTPALTTTPVAGNGALSITAVENPESLLSIEQTDATYTGYKIEMTAENRANLEGLVMGEAGGEGFIGAAIVAQAIRDGMVLIDNYDTLNLKATFGYDANISSTPNEDVKEAVAWIFDEGNCAVQHRILYFYSPLNMSTGSSSFHESQNHIVTYGGHKVFDRWY